MYDCPNFRLNGGYRFERVCIQTIVVLDSNAHRGVRTNFLPVFPSSWKLRRFRYELNARAQRGALCALWV